jgi:hypothetical protein
VSLEQALLDATAAIKLLTTVLVSASEAGAVSAPPKATRTKKDEPAAAPAGTPAQTFKEEPGYLIPGDPAGTRYFHVPAHNTVYRQAPGDMDCTLSGAIIVSGAEYLKQKAAIEAAFPSAAAVAAEKLSKESAAAVTTAASTASLPSASSEPTFEQVVEKMRELHKAQQAAGMQVVLTKFGAAKVPDLKGKASNADLISAIDAQLLGL